MRRTPHTNCLTLVCSWDLAGDVQGKLSAVSFISRAPRVYEPPQRSVLDFKLNVSGLDYDLDEEEGGRKHGIHQTMQKTVDETGRKYYNMRSPTGRFAAKTKSQVAWDERLASLEYDIDCDRYQSTTKNVERSARSFPGMCVCAGECACESVFVS